MEVPAIPLWAAAFLGGGLAVRIMVGMWVLRRALMIRGRAEVFIGSFVLLLALGELFAVIATRMRGGPFDGLVPTFGVIALLAIVLATLAQAEGLRRLFRPGNTQLLAAVIGLGIVIAFAAWARLAGGAAVVVTQSSAANLLLLTAGLALDCWWATESWLMADRLRRQSALGIGNHDTAARRFQFWALAALSHAAVTSCLIVCAAIFQRPAAEMPLILCVIGLAGGVSALAIYASFHLPVAIRDSPGEASSG